MSLLRMVEVLIWQILSARLKGSLFRAINVHSSGLGLLCESTKLLVEVIALFIFVHRMIYVRLIREGKLLLLDKFLYLVVLLSCVFHCNILLNILAF